MNVAPSSACFAPSVPLRAQLTRPRARHLLAARPARPYAPSMRLGLPRIFAPSTRTAPEKATPVVQQVDTPSPFTTTPQRAASWMRAHPLQAAAMLALLFSTVRRALATRAAAAASTTVTVAGVSGSGTGGSGTGGSDAAPRRVRAVPKMHQGTDEALDLLTNMARKYIIVGGKGGVGKTSMSAAVATAFADRGQTTLIVSTDPAHSLSDAFGQSVAGGDPVPVSSVDNLYAQEVDPDSMKRTFKMMNDMDGARSLGMDDMGLDELNSLFDTIPPGFDEAVALVEIVKYIEGDAEYARFDRIVFDTAPTGHTLRLLALPDFLNGFFGKIISMKSKFGNIMSQFKGMFGNDVNMDNSVQEMEELKRSMNMVRELFRDEIQTEFIVATIPNMMAIAESKRLVDELRKESIPVRHLFVNQMQPANDECTFCAARFKEQASNLTYLRGEMQNLQLSTVQSFDKEIRGAPALRAMASQLFPECAPRVEGSTESENDAARSLTSHADGGSESDVRRGDKPNVTEVELVE